MSEQGEPHRLEGLVQASRHEPNGVGKQFLGVMMACSDGQKWVVDYDEQSPLHAFADCHVVASGHPYDPSGGQHLIGTVGSEPLGHFRVLTMRLAGGASDSGIVSIGEERRLNGRFKRRQSDSAGPTLLFVTDRGESFVVVNDPAGLTLKRNLSVSARPVELSGSTSRGAEQHIWAICPHSTADLWEWRRKRS